MSMTTGILSVVALGAIGSAIYETNQVKRAESVTAAIVRDRDALRSQLREVQQHVSRSDQRATDLQGQVDALHASKTPPPSTSIVAVTTSANGLTRTRQAEEEDALKRAAEEVAQRKTARIQQLDRDYHTLYRQLGLTPAQITQFKTLVRENFDRRDELGKLAAAQGLKPGDPAMQGLFTQADVDFRTKMQNAFGEAAWQAMQHFNETALLRNVVGNLAGSLLYTDAPITPAQASEIVEIMWNNMHTAQGKLDASAEKIDALMTQARAVLSSVQLEALRQSIKVGEGKAREASPERQAVGY